MAVNLETITVDGIRLMEDTDFALDITVTDSDDNAIDWTAYTLASGLSEKAGDTPHTTAFVTGDANGVLSFSIAEATIDTIIAADYHRSLMIVTADDGTTKSRIFEAEVVISRGKSA